MRVSPFHKHQISLLHLRILPDGTVAGDFQADIVLYMSINK